MPLINRRTGQPATEAEYAACAERARELLYNPYSAPEQVAWAQAIVDLPVPWQGARAQARYARSNRAAIAKAEGGDNA